MKLFWDIRACLFDLIRSVTFLFVWFEVDVSKGNLCGAHGSAQLGRHSTDLGLNPAGFVSHHKLLTTKTLHLTRSAVIAC
jgi:hypothetical protein